MSPLTRPSTPLAFPSVSPHVSPHPTKHSPGVPVSGVLLRLMCVALVLELTSAKSVLVSHACRDLTAMWPGVCAQVRGEPHGLGAEPPVAPDRAGDCMTPATTIETPKQCKVL